MPTEHEPPRAEVPDQRVDEPEPRGAIFWGLLRLAMGWIFFWAFLDKLLALGFATGRDPETGVVDRFGPTAWIEGASPTEGFLSFGLNTKEPFLGFYSDLAGQGWVDWIYMISMAAIGVALLLGIFTTLAALGGAVWMVLFYTASAIWPENNPFLDDHVVEFIVLLGIAYVGAGRYLGLGRWWENTALVSRYPLLR